MSETSIRWNAIRASLDKVPTLSMKPLVVASTQNAHNKMPETMLFDVEEYSRLLQPLDDDVEVSCVPSIITDMIDNAVSSSSLAAFTAPNDMQTALNLCLHNVRHHVLGSPTQSSTRTFAHRWPTQESIHLLPTTSISKTMLSTTHNETTKNFSSGSASQWRSVSANMATTPTPPVSVSSYRLTKTKSASDAVTTSDRSASSAAERSAALVFDSTSIVQLMRNAFESGDFTNVEAFTHMYEVELPRTLSSDVSRAPSLEYCGNASVQSGVCESITKSVSNDTLSAYESEDKALSESSQQTCSDSNGALDSDVTTFKWHELHESPTAERPSDVEASSELETPSDTDKPSDAMMTNQCNLQTDLESSFDASSSTDDMNLQPNNSLKKHTFCRMINRRYSLESQTNSFKREPIPVSSSMSMSHSMRSIESFNSQRSMSVINSFTVTNTAPTISALSDTANTAHTHATVPFPVAPRVPPTPPHHRRQSFGTSHASTANFPTHNTHTHQEEIDSVQQCPTIASEVLQDDSKTMTRERISFINVAMKKHGRYGRPKPKLVSVDQALGIITWGNNFVGINEVMQIRKGRQTSVLARSHARRLNEGLFFSLACKSRTVDFETESRSERNELVTQIQTAIKLFMSAEQSKNIEWRKHNVQNDEIDSVPQSGTGRKRGWKRLFTSC